MEILLVLFIVLMIFLPLGAVATLVLALSSVFFKSEQDGSST